MDILFLFLNKKYKIIVVVFSEVLILCSTLQSRKCHLLLLLVYESNRNSRSIPTFLKLQLVSTLGLGYINFDWFGLLKKSTIVETSIDMKWIPLRVEFISVTLIGGIGRWS